MSSSVPPEVKGELAPQWDGRQALGIPPVKAKSSTKEAENVSALSFVKTRSDAAAIGAKAGWNESAWALSGRPVRGGANSSVSVTDTAGWAATAGAVCGGASHCDTTAAAKSNPILFGGGLAITKPPGTARPVRIAGDAAVMPIAVS